MLFKLFASTVICAFIGWVTNYIAIKMLFHPRMPLTICGLTIQGIFPKRQKALAANLAAVIEEKLLSHDDIQEFMHRPEIADKLKEKIQDGFAEFLSKRLGSLNPMIAMFLDSAMMEKIRTLLDAELDRIMPGLLETATGELEKHMDFRLIIQEKIEDLSMDKLEELLMSIMSKEFKFVELVGAVLGGLIGLIQALLFL